MTYLKVVAVCVALASAAVAQNVISAKSGLIHYTEGEVTVDGMLVAPKMTEFPDLPKGKTLVTKLGRAEVLLTPGVFLRIAENSAVRMISNSLEDTKVELLEGSALLEVGEITGHESLVVAVGSSTLEFPKRGLFRVDYDPARLRVYDGSAVAISGNGTTTVKEGRELRLAGVTVTEKFNKEIGDSFHRWAGRRAGYISMANLAAAKSVRDNGQPWRVSGWLYNPYFGSFTYIPASMIYVSPFGWHYYPPNRVHDVYYRPAPASIQSNPMDGMVGGMRGHSNMGGRSSGAYAGSAPAVPPPAPSSAPAPAAPPRSADSGGGSREAGGGR